MKYVWIMAPALLATFFYSSSIALSQQTKQTTTLQTEKFQLPEAMNSGQSSFGSNRMLISGEGRVYLIDHNTLFRMQRDEGDVWERVAEDVQTASFDPRNEKIIYRVNSDNQITKSLDGGKKWISINNGLPKARINLITVHPVNSDEVFAGTELGLYKTSDAGFSWEPTSLRSAILSFYLASKDPAIRYALIGDGSIVISTNNGETWTKSDNGLPSELIRVRGKPPTRITAKAANLFFVDHAKPFLLATTYENGLFRSDDSGASWKKSDTGLNQGDRFWSIYIGNSEVIIAGSALARSSNGTNWTRLPVVTTRFAPNTFDGITRHPKSDGLLVLFRYQQDSQERSRRIGYITKDGVLVGLNYGLVPRSNIVSTWAGQFAGKRALFATVSNSTPTDQGYARSVNNGAYYVVSGTYNVDGGTYFSINDGLSWEYLLSPECGSATIARPGDPNDVWMYGDGPCLLRLQGENLTGIKATGTQFQAANDSVSKVAFDPVDKSLLYYTAGVNENSLYRYKYDPAINKGQTVQLSVAASDVVVCEDNPKIMLAGVGKFSTDGGWTWLNKSAALQQYLTRGYGEGYRRGDLRLLSCRTNEFRVIVHHYDSRLESEAFWVMKSSNLGDSWEVASVYKGQLKRIFIDPADSTNMFVVAQTFMKSGFSNRGDAVKVLETRNSGDAWQEIYSYKLSRDDEYSEDKIVNAVSQLKVGNGRSLFVGGLIGLWRSDNEGSSWYRLGGVRQPIEIASTPKNDEPMSAPERIDSVNLSPTELMEQLLPISKKLSQATTNGDRATLESYLSADFIYRDVGNRKSMDRTKFLSRIKRNNGMSNLSCGDYKLNHEGEQVTLTYICEYDLSSLILANHVTQRITDRFAKQNSQWKLVGQDTIVLPKNR